MYSNLTMNAYGDELMGTLRGILARNENLLQVTTHTGATWREPNEQQLKKMLRRASASRVVLTHAPHLALNPFSPLTQATMRYWTEMFSNGILHVERDAMHHAQMLPEAWRKAYAKKLEELLIKDPLAAGWVMTYPHLHRQSKKVVLAQIEHLLGCDPQPS